MRRRAIAILFLTFTLVGCLARADTVVFLVRHAEKAGQGKDPSLSAAGVERAARLATTLRDAEIQHVHSSDYVRTRDTAAPIAAAYGLQVQLYDPRDLPALAKRLRETGGRHLVVGHSNTTPAMVELLGGKPHSPIDEKGEYDRLYIVTIGEDGAASSVMMRYGSIYTGEEREPITRGEATLHPSLRWEDSRLVFLTRIVRAGGESTNVVRYTLEEDGVLLVAEEKFRGSEQSYDNHWVFEKEQAR